MSRSFKKAFSTVSKKMADNVHRVVRHRVKARLAKINIEEPDEITLLDIEADTKEMGLEEYGTKFGLEFDDLKCLDNDADAEEWKEDIVRMRRK